MKTERITVLASPEFKAFLAHEAEQEGVSVSELVRQRCVQQPDEDEEILSLLVDELRASNKATEAKLDKAIAAVNNALETIQRLRRERDAQEATA